MEKNILLEAESSLSESEATLNGITLGRFLFQGLLETGVILPEDWQALKEETRRSIVEGGSAEEMLAALVETKLLTEYQASRALTGNAHQLVLGPYRLLERIGSGGMGIVYRGEHRLLRRPVAIKVLQTPADENQVLLQRFFVEMRALARIRHANIVWALDAGTIKASEHGTQNLHYLVMEHVKGTNLEQLAANGPLSVAQACDLGYQIAGALEETNKLNLIHRDIKPSNILLAPDGSAKLLDFGLALHFGKRRLTVPGTLLGTLSYMAPEQVADAANVDIRADIYGLGATLFFCLTGKAPFVAQGHLTQQVASRLTQPTPEVRTLRPEVPADLDAILRRMMAHHRDDRFPTPQSVMRAFLPYVNATTHFSSRRRRSEPCVELPSERASSSSPIDRPRILLVDDERLVRDTCKSFFRREQFDCQEAGDGEEGLAVAAQSTFDLVLLDIDMPRLNGIETLRRLRQNPPCNHLKIIMMSGGVTADEMAELLAVGADDYLPKPLSRNQLLARTKAALLHKAAQDRSETLNQQLLGMNAELEQTLAARNGNLAQARNALVFALARLVESRSEETPEHLTRMTQYATCLALEAHSQPRLASVLDEPFVKTLEACTILHDIGNIALPDHILRRTGPLDPEDNIVMQSHTTIGAETLRSVAKRDRGAAAFWQMAMDIAQHHHERFDGNGYPDRLAGSDAPLAARIVALADAYDGLRAPGPHGLALSHNAAVEMMLEGSPGRFDPLLLRAFAICEADFDGVYRAHPDEKS